MKTIQAFDALNGKMVTATENGITIHFAFEKTDALLFSRQMLIAAEKLAGEDNGFMQMFVSIWEECQSQVLNAGDLAAILLDGAETNNEQIAKTLKFTMKHNPKEVKS